MKYLYIFLLVLQPFVMAVDETNALVANRSAKNVTYYYTKNGVKVDAPTPDAKYTTIKIKIKNTGCKEKQAYPALLRCFCIPFLCNNSCDSELSMDISVELDKENVNAFLDMPCVGEEVALVLKIDDISGMNFKDLSVVTYLPEIEKYDGKMPDLHNILLKRNHILSFLPNEELKFTTEKSLIFSVEIAADGIPVAKNYYDEYYVQGDENRHESHFDEITYPPNNYTSDYCYPCGLFSFLCPVNYSIKSGQFS